LINKWGPDLNKYYTKEHIHVGKAKMKLPQIIQPLGKCKLKSQ
jgi:hypothetical protein